MCKNCDINNYKSRIWKQNLVFVMVRPKIWIVCLPNRHIPSSSTTGSCLLLIHFYKVFFVLPPQNRLLWRHQPKKNERISDWCQTQVSQNKLDLVKDLKTWRKMVIWPRKGVILSVFYVDAMWQKNAKVKNNFNGKGMNFKHFISLRQNVLTSEP